MTGYMAYLKIKALETEIDKLGLELHGAKYGSSDDITIRIPLSPDSYATWPVYTRGAVLHEGTLETAMYWIMGLNAHRNYMNMLGMNKQIKKAEDRVAGGVIMRRLKGKKDKESDESPF